jgi:hypothetical protein
MLSRLRSLAKGTSMTSARDSGNEVDAIGTRHQQSTAVDVQARLWPTKPDTAHNGVHRRLAGFRRPQHLRTPARLLILASSSMLPYRVMR